MNSYRIHYSRNTACILAKDFEEAKEIGRKLGFIDRIECLDTGERWPKKSAQEQMYSMMHGDTSYSTWGAQQLANSNISPDTQQNQSILPWTTGIINILGL